jgi:hypothetical protein
MMLTALIGIASGNQPDEQTADRVAGLVKRLGHPNFTIREQAGKELDAIGEPALGALRNAAAGDDSKYGAGQNRLLLRSLSAP